MKTNRKSRKGLMGLPLAIISTLTLLVATTSTTTANAATPITFVTPAYIPGTVAAFNTAVADWNKANPNTPVNLVPGDWGNLGDQLTTQFASGTAPDVIHFDSISILNFAARGYLSDITGDFLSLRSKIPQGEWKAASYKARLYGVPVIDQPYVIFVNLDLFKKAGVSVPTKSLSWDDFADLSKKLTTSGTYGLSVGLLRPATIVSILSTNFGGKFFTGYSSGRAKIRITNDELEVPRRFYKMVYKDKSIDPLSLTVSAAGAEANFLAGKSAMLLMGSYAAADMDVAAKEKGFNWSVMPLLKGSAGALQGAGPQTFSISAQSKVKKEAARFINFMMQDKYLVPIALGDGLVPMTDTALTAAIAAKKGSPGWQQIFADGANFTVPNFTYVPEFANWKNSVLLPGLQKYMQNKISEDVLRKTLIDGWQNLR